MKPAKNNSLFRRHFIVTASMILLAFTILLFIAIRLDASTRQFPST